MFERKYNAATDIGFPLITKGATDLITSASFAAGDVQLIIDNGAPANANNTPVHEGNGWYSLALDAAELQGKIVVVTIVDQTDPKVWEDQVAVVETYGNASARHAFDRDTAQQLVTIAAMNTNVLTSAAIASGAITTSAFASAAISSAKIAGGAIGAAQLATDAAEKIADAILTRGISNVEPAAFRTLYGAIASLVNRRRITPAGDEIEVYETDDSTILKTIAITRASGDPVTELDPP